MVALDLTRRLSPHFSLGEMVRTSHRTVDNVPDLETVERLTILCTEFLEPVRNVWGPLWITSGYRCEELNTLLRASYTSAHMWGCAVDFIPMWGMPTASVVRWIADSRLPFDQVIDEYSSTSNWIHIGMAKPGQDARGHVLTMRGGKYTHFQETT